MKIRRLTWQSFRIPLRRDFTTSQESASFRELIVVRLETEQGFGLGEIAPLPSAGPLARAASLLAPLDARALDAEELIAAVPGDSPMARAVRCGLDIAVCDLMAKAQGLSVAGLLGGRPRAVAVNATIAQAAPQDAARAAAEAVAQGFRTVKLKVGVMPDIEAECARAALIRRAIGNRIGLRLDANQAWDMDEAIVILRALEPLGIEYVEQPVAASALTELAGVRRRVRVPIAADEAVSGPASVHQLIELEAADLVIIKPMVVGGLRAAQAIVRQAALGGLDAVITTTIDSGVAVTAALHLAAALELRRACGLATGALLESDLTAGEPSPHDGVMDCPAGPGLGVTIDTAGAAGYLTRLDIQSPDRLLSNR